MTTEQDKWQFCEFKECFYCDADLEDADYPITEKVITYCYFCKRSFCD